MNRIEEMLRETMGLDAASIGSSLINRSVRLRMKVLGLKHVEPYSQLLATSSAEWKELVEAVVVTETWFFRDREPFAALVRLVQEEWLPAHPTAPLRLLSLPCSSGEEPYSIAIALHDAGVPSGRFQIDAADISGRALERARQGIYRKNSFRGDDLSFRERHFWAGKEGFTLNPPLRQGVNFYQGNLLTKDFLAGKGTYDFIFCRNLLIYFDRPTQQKALRKIEGLLSPDGVLFVGPAELPLVLDQGYVSAGIPMAFACRKTEPAVRQVRAARAPKSSSPPSGSSYGALNLGRDARAAGETPAPPPGGSRETRPPGNRREQQPGLGILRGGHRALADATLETARQYADAGLLSEAVEVCERHLREYGASANAYYLLGLVLDAQSSPRAIDCYRKALYLQPNHYETLLQMAVLSQRDGDAVRADRFKRRARRSVESAIVGGTPLKTAD